jgi:phage gp46-like protein
MSKKSSVRASQMSDSQIGNHHDLYDIQHEGGEETKIEGDLFLLIKSWWGDKIALKQLAAKLTDDSTITAQGLSQVWKYAGDRAEMMLDKLLKKVYKQAVQSISNENARIKDKIMSILMVKSMDQVNE